ncbi:hypothetical protein B0H10DRAFT_238514 [Mycena sp. CBHHK59/15]|nr:hypothetical protein B0H10DRAFT_238514 [Mycena sp. CBHHK59/15]
MLIGATDRDHDVTMKPSPPSPACCAHPQRRHVTLFRRAERRHVHRSLIHDRVVKIAPLAYMASPLVQKVHQALDIEWVSNPVGPPSPCSRGASDKRPQRTKRSVSSL